MKNLNPSRYALCFCIGVALALLAPRHSQASLVPGAKHCGDFDSQQTIEGEKTDLSHQLPAGYRKFEIVLFHERLLRVVVATASGSVSRETPQYQHVVGIWGDVLSAHHHSCVVGVYAVQFVTRNGKMLSEIAVSE